MEYNINIRQNQLQNCQQFIESAKLNLQTLLDTFGWSKENVKEEDRLVTCVYDKTHRIASKNLQQHLETCSLKRLGYNVTDVQLSEPTDNIKSSVTIDTPTKQNIFMKAKIEYADFKNGWNGDEDPKTSERLMSTFSSDERLALYNFAVSATEGPKIPLEFDLNQPHEDNQELTYEQRLESERNAKRRRIKYKAVHTSRKSHTEIMREVISNQMDLYIDYLAPKDDNSSGKARVHVHSQNSCPNIEKPECDDTMNGLYEETRSVGSKHSTHSGTSSHYKSNKRSSRGSSTDYRDTRCAHERDRRREHKREHRKQSHHDDYKDHRHSSRNKNDKKSERKRYTRGESHEKTERRRSASRDNHKRSRNDQSAERSGRRHDKNGHCDEKRKSSPNEHQQENRAHSHQSDLDAKRRRISQPENGRHHTERQSRDN